MEVCADLCGVGLSGVYTATASLFGPLAERTRKDEAGQKVCRAGIRF